MHDRQVKKQLFVTVGTTQFEELVTQVLHPDILEVNTKPVQNFPIIQFNCLRLYHRLLREKVTHISPFK